MESAITENDAAAAYLESLPAASWAHQPYYDPFSALMEPEIANASQQNGNEGSHGVETMLGDPYYDSESSEDALPAPPAYDDGYGDDELPSGGAAGKKGSVQKKNTATKSKKGQGRKIGNGRVTKKKGSSKTTTENTSKSAAKKPTTTAKAAPKAATSKATAPTVAKMRFNIFSNLQDPMKYAAPTPGGDENFEAWWKKNKSADCSIYRSPELELWREKANALRVSGYTRVLAKQRWDMDEAKKQGKTLTKEEKAAHEAELGNISDWLAKLTGKHQWDEAYQREFWEKKKEYLEAGYKIEYVKEEEEDAEEAEENKADPDGTEEDEEMANV